MSAPDQSTPIDDALAALSAFSAEERRTLATLPGVRTFGDLVVVVERGEVEKPLAAKLKKAIKV